METYILKWIFIAYISSHNIIGSHCQISTHPVVIGRLGSPAVLTCHSNGVPIQLCLWEQKESDILIATFDLHLPNYAENGKPYSYHGDGLDKGICGIKIKTVTEGDLQRWKCTMLGRDNATAVFRGTVLLQGAETLEADEPSFFNINSGSGTTSKPSVRQEESRNFNSNHPRPIVTAEGSVSSAPAPVVHSSKGIPVQEVEIQSGGLIIVPKRKDRKLVIL